MARVLMVTSRLPWPPTEGHQLRSWHLLRALAREHRVTLLSCLRPEDAGTTNGELPAAVTRLAFHHLRQDALSTAVHLVSSIGGRLPFVVHRYAGTELRGKVGELARDADLVHFDMLPLMACADRVPAGVPVIYNAHNVEHVLLRARSANESRPLHRAFLRSQVDRLMHFETMASRRADLVLACSEPDRMQLVDLGARTAITVPNGVDLDGNRPGMEDEDGSLVFVGQMGWFPNRDGVDWFLSDVLPRVLARKPKLRFTLVGKAQGLQVPANVAANVDVSGFVDDLRPLVHRASVYVVPLRMGSGTRLKVLEAMAFGKAIVTTSIGSEGIDLKEGVHAEFADDAQSFADRILALLNDPVHRAALGREARRLAEARYGWDAIGEAMLPHYERLLAA
ncbi:MAG: glycosyltransferase [Xanthomonadales bacterium]|nr:glycosyltransferase [Xanthomonadales bacterium]